MKIESPEQTMFLGRAIFLKKLFGSVSDSKNEAMSLTVAKLKVEIRNCVPVFVKKQFGILPAQE